MMMEGKKLLAQKHFVCPKVRVSMSLDLVSEADVKFFEKNGWLLTDTLVHRADELKQFVDEVKKLSSCLYSH